MGVNKINPALESTIHNEISSRVSLQSLKKIINLERKNYKSKKQIKFIHDRHSCISQMIDSIKCSQDSQMIIEALSIFLRDKFNPLNNLYKDVLTDEALVRATRGDLSIQQLIDCCKILFAFRDYKCKEAIDYFWIGFIIKQNEISAEHVVSMFRLLKHFNRSKYRIQLLLEKKFLENYQKFSVYQITELMNIFQNLSLSPTIMDCIGKWTNAHLNSVSKYDLLEFIEGLSSAKYVSPCIEKTVEKILSTKTVKNNDHALITALAVYCSSTHLRNSYILNKIVEYFEKYGKNFPLKSLVNIVEAFGELNFKPQTRGIFWTNFENILFQKYRDLQAAEILNILVSCAYVDKYFPKFASSIFTPEFLDQIHSQNDTNKIQVSRNQLYLLDTAMTIECKLYNGPFLFRPGDPSVSLVDEKINFLISEIQEELIKLAGHGEKLSQHVILNMFSKTPLYTIDALIHHNDWKVEQVLDFNLRKNKHHGTAVLILLPDFYCWNSNELIGEQAMKVRHLRKLGFKLMLLDFKLLRELKKSSGQVEKYLKHQFQIAQEAL